MNILHHIHDFLDDHVWPFKRLTELRISCEVTENQRDRAFAAQEEAEARLFDYRPWSEPKPSPTLLKATQDARIRLLQEAEKVYREEIALIVKLYLESAENDAQRNPHRYTSSGYFDAERETLGIRFRSPAFGFTTELFYWMGDPPR